MTGITGVIRLRWLPANQAWCFLFGDDIATATLVSMGGRTLFPMRSDAVAEARDRGLTVRLCRARVMTALYGLATQPVVPVPDPVLLYLTAALQMLVNRSR